MVFSRYKAKLLFGLCDFCVAYWQITGPSRSKLIRNLYTGGLNKGMYQFQHGNATACTDIKCLHALISQGIIHCSHMGLRQVHDMDKIPDTGAIWRIIIIAENG